MHEIDSYGRVINQYGLEMGWNGGVIHHFYNPCAEINYPEPVEDKKDYKYLLIRRR
jgi:hypothetical protein